MADRAKKKVNEKRKKKGLGEMIPREHAVSTQYVQYGMSAFLAKTILFPLDRFKVLAQVNHMQALKPELKPTGELDIVKRVYAD